MSAHGPFSRSRAPNPKTYEREAFQVAHVRFEVCDHPEHGKTFALFAGDPLDPKFQRPLFTGFVHRGMGTQLRRLAHRIDELEEGLPFEGEGE
jgi:hypothetical protein